ncbi:MAG TPA: ABC transporter substrate-binding protein [Beijerinckiaceae bacterium]|nr:ABC transporter substrate-binding protein [Beijerinckiaceae bacterium]
MRAATRIALAALTIVLAHAAHAQDALKLAVGQRGNWENAMPELGQKAGIFKKHGLELEILYTQGGGETQQAVISGSVDIGIGVGTGGAMGAFAKGAPIRAFANSMTGAHDLYWYVPANSPIKSMKDAGGRSIAYSTRGSSTNMIVLGFAKHFGIDAKPIAAGNPASTFTQTMSGQIDVGWASPPFGVEAIEQGRIRVVARGSDVPSFRDQTVRVQIVNAAALEAKKDALARFVQAWRETIAWMYADPAAIKAYAEWVNVPEALARRVRDEFYPKENLDPDRIAGIEQAVTDAIELKFLSAPLTKEQLDRFFQLQPATK